MVASRSCTTKWVVVERLAEQLAGSDDCSATTPTRPGWSRSEQLKAPVIVQLRPPLGPVGVLAGQLTGPINCSATTPTRPGWGRS